MTSLFLAGCCLIERRDEPAYPLNVPGWQEHYEGGARILGEFVLRTSEMIDNGRVQLKIVNLIPPKPCAEPGTFQRQARARIQFIRLSDNKIVGDDLFAERGTMSLSAVKDGINLDELGISVIYIYDINLKDGWVHFELRG